MTMGDDDMAKKWRKGDKVRNKKTREVVTVCEFKPEGFLLHEMGFTFRVDSGPGWSFINDYELVERADNMDKTNDGIIKMTLNDGSVIEGTAEEIAKLQRLVSDGEPVSNECEVGPKTFPKPAQIGDRIKIVDASHADVIEGNYGNGDVMTVIEIDNDGDVLKTNKFDGIILSTEFEIIGRGELSKREMSFLRAGREIGGVKEGDIVKVIGDYVDGSNNKDGDIGVVTEVEEISESIDKLTTYVTVSGRSQSNGCGWHNPKKSLELVCSVEKRTDLA